jgi:DNA helicase-2/ATP-dependent DNA helicase PcrA
MPDTGKQMMDTVSLGGLNINQRRAVEWTGGPLLVLAGPGSGKTRVLTLRVARLVKESGEERFRVIGLTFTTKAAAEMRTRLDELVPDAGDRVLLTTFHSFAADILRQHGSHVGMRPDFTILNQPADRDEVMKDSIRELQRQGVEVEEGDIKLFPLIDNLMEKLVPEKEVVNRIRDRELGCKLSALYAEYRRQLVSNNRLDFQSLLVLAVELLSSKPSVAKQLRAIYPHICVDEFQDTNFAQYRLLRAVAGDSPKDLFVVADDDQIIYQWNGASPERLKELTDDYKMEVIQLPVNYRCPPSVIALANNLISHNTSRSAGKAPLAAVKESEIQDAVRLKHFESVDEEVSWVAKDIAGRKEADRASCVVLARTRKLIELAARALNGAGVEAAVAVRKSEFESAPLRWLHGVLRLANARGDKEQLRRICKSFYELEGIDMRVEDVLAASSAEGGDLLRSWIKEALARSELESYTRQFLESAMKEIVERLEFSSFIASSFKWFSQVERRLAGEGSHMFVDYSEECETWKELEGSILQRFGKEHVTLQVLLQEMDLAPKTPPISKSAVRCFTIHSAKGMEFEHVYLIGLAEDQLPSFQSIKVGDESREMQEERRNCFVALTRAQTSITLTYADNYFGWGKRPSRFLREMNLDLGG